MTRHAEVTFAWGDGTYRFRLGIGQWRELQAKLKVGPPALYARVLNMQFETDDLREIMRNALIGGEQVDPLGALRLVEFYCDERPFLESWLPCINIMKPALFMAEEEEKKSPDGEASGASESLGIDTISAPSTATVQ